MEQNLLIFNGMPADPISKNYHLGNGYRAYNTMLGRFNGPDSWSPFSAGGINSYIYCTGDPVTQADPSGHFSLGQGIGLALSFAAGIVLTIVTEGMALPAVMTFISTMTGDAAINAAGELVTETIDGKRANMNMIGVAASQGAVATLFGFGLGSAIQVTESFYNVAVESTMQVLGKLNRVNGMIGITMSGEFRNARFLGIYRRPEQVEWNLRFDDQIPAGTRRNYILGGVWEGQSLRVRNETYIEGQWRVNDITPLAFSTYANTDDDIMSYRLIFPHSARTSYYGGFNFARQFHSALNRPVPVLGYRETPILVGPLSETLGRLEQLVTNMDLHGYVVYGDAAQSVLDELSRRFSHSPGSVIVEGGEPRSYPQI